MAYGKKSVLPIGKLSVLVPRVVSLELRLRPFESNKEDLSAKISRVQSKMLLTARLFTSLRPGSHIINNAFMLF